MFAKARISADLLRPMRQPHVVSSCLRGSSSSRAGRTRRSIATALRPLWFGVLAVLSLAGAAFAAGDAAADDDSAKQIFRGKVVLLRDALKARGIASFDEMKDQVALETPDGELIPIVADWRGRAFFQDERLRDRQVELLGHRKRGVPYLQVLVIYTFDEKGRRQHTDYWCDICAIPMYEIKPCDCCQGKIELRFRPADDE